MECHTRWFTLENTGQNNKLKTQRMCINYTQPRKSKQHKTQQNKNIMVPGSVAFYDTRPGNEVNLFYNTPE